MSDTMMSDDYLRAAIHIFNAQVVERLHGVIFDPELGVIEVVSDAYLSSGEDGFEDVGLRNSIQGMPDPDAVRPNPLYQDDP